MTPIFRRTGWLLMALALGVAVAARWGGVSHYGPFPAVVVAMLVGGAGVLLVVTDRMVRALYMQVGPAAAAARSEAAKSESVAAPDAFVGGDGDDVAVGSDLDRT